MEGMKVLAVDAWLEGKVGAEDDDTASTPRPEPVRYWYGAYRTTTGKLASFMTRRESAIPSGTLIVRVGVGYERVQQGMKAALCKGHHRCRPGRTLDGPSDVSWRTSSTVGW